MLGKLSENKFLSREKRSYSLITTRSNRKILNKAYKHQQKQAQQQ